MYGFEPSEEQQMLVDSVRRFAVNDLRPAAHEADETGNFPESVIRKGWELGVLQASIPEAYGGFGERSVVTGALAAEVLAWGDLAGALAVMTPGLFAIPILSVGTEEQKLEHLPRLAEGDWSPVTAAFIEPAFNFHSKGMRTTATPDGDGFVIEGEKAFVPFIDRADSALVYARVNGDPQAFVVARGVDGFQICERERLMGIRGLPTYRIKLDRVHVPASARLGGPAGHDFSPLAAATNVAVAALGVGLSQAAYDYALNYAKEREAFGAPIAQKQSIAFMLAEMVTEIEASRLLVWEAAWMLDAGRDAGKAAFLALTSVSDTAMMVSDRAVQILGGHGYIREHPVELWMRNGRGLPSFAGLAMV
jgi:alkylation response protein AidB-like acyl-CoA dehydrogenase